MMTEDDEATKPFEQKQQQQQQQQIQRSTIATISTASKFISEQQTDKSNQEKEKKLQAQEEEDYRIQDTKKKNAEEVISKDNLLMVRQNGDYVSNKSINILKKNNNNTKRPIEDNNETSSLSLNEMDNNYSTQESVDGSNNKQEELGEMRTTHNKNDSNMASSDHCERISTNQSSDVSIVEDDREETIDKKDNQSTSSATGAIEDETQENHQNMIQTQQQHQQYQYQQRHNHVKYHQKQRSNKLNNYQQQHGPASTSTGSSDQQVPISADYLAQLIKDKKQLSAFPSVFVHLPRLLDEEINKVRQSLFQLNDVVHLDEPLELPEPEGEFIQLQEKIYVPVSEHPEYNFVGRLLGPRGMTAKQLEQETGCKIMIRGKGSMRDKRKEEQNRGKANWEHLNEELHVLITVEDTQNRAQIKLKRALDEVKQLLVPIVDGEDELKKRQLMELAIINGTYRDCNFNEALSKMLTDAVYKQALNEQQINQQQQQQQYPAVTNGSPSGNQASKHYQHYLNCSSVSSGVPSTGSNTPNSIQGQQHYNNQQVQKHQHMNAASASAKQRSGSPQTSGRPRSDSNDSMNNMASSAGSTNQQTSITAQRNQPHPGSFGPLIRPITTTVSGTLPTHHHPRFALQTAIPPPPPLPASHLAAAAAAAAHHHHHHQSPAMAAAAAAAAALMANSADPNALLYAQQYHEFHHYASMAAAAQAGPLMAPDYGHHLTSGHHPQSAAAAAAVAQAVAQAAAAANQQLHHHHHYQQQVESSTHQAAVAAYHHNQQQQQQLLEQQQIHQGQESARAETSDNNGGKRTNTNDVVGSHLTQSKFVGKLTNQTSSTMMNSTMSVRHHPYKRPGGEPSSATDKTTGDNSLER